jgi:hypothetical protein
VQLRCNVGASTTLAAGGSTSAFGRATSEVRPRGSDRGQWMRAPAALHRARRIARRLRVTLSWAGYPQKVPTMVPVPG